LLLASLLAGLAATYSSDNDDEYKAKAGTKTIFVVEMVRHGARSHHEDNVDSKEFFGVPKGSLTTEGKL